MRHNRDPRLGQHPDDSEIEEPHVRGHRRSRAIARATAVVTAAAAAATFVAACGSSGGSAKTGKTSPSAAASRTPGGSGSSPETPTTPPSPTESTGAIQLTASACSKLSPIVFRILGGDLGYSSLSDAEANCTVNTSPTYDGYDPHIKGPAINWAGVGVTGRAILQMVRNDPDGKIFDSVKSQGAPSSTVDGMPALSMDVPGSSSELARGSGGEYMFTVLLPSDSPDGNSVGSVGSELFGELLSAGA
jgi:hypothetical protein